MFAALPVATALLFGKLTAAKHRGGAVARALGAPARMGLASIALATCMAALACGGEEGKEGHGEQGEAAPSATGGLTPALTGGPTFSLPPVPQYRGSQGFSAKNMGLYRDMLGNTSLAGEVMNDNDFNAQGVIVKAKFLDAGGNTLAEHTGLPDVGIIPAHASAPFKITLLNGPEGIVDYAVAVTGSEAVDPPATGLEFSNVSTRVEFGRVYHVQGKVTNSSGETYGRVSVYCILYNDSGKAIGRGLDIWDTPLGPSESADFDCFDFPNPSEVASHQLWVDGRK